MATEIGFNDLLNFLIQNKEQKFLITFHSMGDRDCIGAALGLQSYLSNSVVATPDFVTSTSRRVLDSLSNKPELLTGKMPRDLFGVIVVDANNFEALGPFEEKLSTLKKPILFIDHHLPHKEEKSKATLFNDESFNSTSSLVYSIINKLGVRPSRDVAVALLSGIIADSFDFHNMHALTFRQISELLESGGISYSRFMEEFADRVPAQNRLTALKDLTSANAEVIGNYLLITGTSSIHASIAAEEAMKVGADASVFWQIGEKEVSISARLKPPLDKTLSVHLGKMMQGIEGIINGHGGGHSGAAGAYGPGKANAKKAVDKIISQLRQKLEE
ncbi:MAG: DHH family phosphoesterase [Candidatus Micrarchaeota archaeon]|nr:DHH family phosphoesterase [Candidatus Micrarchaeota archaeon]